MKTTLTKKGLALFVALLMMFVSYGQIGIYSFADDVPTDQNASVTTETTANQDQSEQSDGSSSGDSKAGDDQADDTSSESNDSEQTEPQGEDTKKLRGTSTKNAGETDGVTVSNMEELMAVVNTLNSEGGSATITIGEDFAINNYVNLTNGTLTILGNDHKITITKRLITLKNSAQLNLGKAGYSKSLQIDSTSNTDPVMDISGSSVLNMYENVTLGPSKCTGSAGCIHMGGTSKFNMYGGTITDCHSTATVAGGVYMAGNSVFNMSGGTITGCTGLQGGAIGLSGAAPIGGDPTSAVTFNMSGGTISNCTDKYVGGGAVCAFTRYPVTFNMTGGTITGCNTTSYGYGGAVSLYTTSDTTFIMDGGSINDNSSTGSSAGYGGALFVYAQGNNTDIQLKSGTITGNSAKIGGGMLVFAGNITVSDGFSMHNNTASTAGDDVYNAGGNLNLGTADTSATLNETGKKIHGWYYDDTENGRARWDKDDLESAELFTHTGSVYTQEYGAKAAHGPFYTVSFDANGKTLTSEPPEDQTVHTGDTATKPSDPTAKGYTFGGWFTEAACENEFDFSTPITEDTKLYAKWTPTEYEITYDLDGGSVSTANPETYTIESDDITLNNPTKTGYKFDGWTGTDLDEPTKNVTIPTGSTGDREYTATWTPIEYTVHFDKNSSKATGSMEDQSFKYDEERELTANAFERDGYDFTGWKTESNGGTDYADGAKVKNLAEGDGDTVTLYAQWTAKATKLVYNGNGGSGSTPDTNGHVDEVVKTASNGFTREGHTFNGWNTESDGSGDSYGVNEDYTLTSGVNELYAQWTLDEYTITYDLDGGSVSGDNPTSYTIESDDITLINPTKKGYEFEGWTGTDLDEATKNVTIETGSTGDREYTATWSPKEYTIIYDLDGGSVDSDNPASYTIESDDITLNNPTKKGYTFEGWTGTDLDEATKNVTIETGSTGDREYTATWSPKEYTITYDLDGGSVDEENPTSYNIESDDITLNNPTKKGYTFEGWTGTDLDEATKNVTIETGSTGDREYTATWSPKEYTITYDLDGGSVSTANPGTYTIESDDITLNNPTKTGYKFNGWTGTGLDEATKNVTIPTGSTGDREYTATWSPIEYTVHFDKNSSKATGEMEDQSFEYDEEKALTANAFARNGYTFTGWNTKADGSGTDYADEAKVKNLTDKDGGTVTLYAQWTANDSKLVYNGNGGDGSVDDTEGKVNETVKIASNGFTYKGHTFTGWNTETDGSGDAYSEGDDFTLEAAPVVLYAQWSINQYTVTFDTKGGKNKPEDQTVDYNEKASKPSDPKKSGYNFKGWYNGNKKYDFNSPVTDDLKLIARWEKKPKPAPTPAPDNNNNGRNGNGSPANRPAAGNQTPAAAQAPAANAPTNTPTAQIEDPATPQTDGTDITDPAVPLEEPVKEGHWALINLICVLLSLIAAALVWFRKKSEDDDREETNTKRTVAKILCLALAIASVIIFFLTENLTMPMQLVDIYTILMIVIMAACLAIAIIVRRMDNEGEVEEA